MRMQFSKEFSFLKTLPTLKYSRVYAAKTGRAVWRTSRACPHPGAADGGSTTTQTMRWVDLKMVKFWDGRMVNGFGETANGPDGIAMVFNGSHPLAKRSMRSHCFDGWKQPLVPMELQSGHPSNLIE